MPTKVLTLAALALLTSCQHPDFASILDRDRDTIPTPPATPGTPDTPDTATFTIHINDQWEE